jgi:flagellar basal-body rod protein FlgF
MENTTYVGLGKQTAVMQQLDITANNIANMSTPGFKAERMLFLDHIKQARGVQPLHQSYNYGTYRDLSEGSMQQTFNPLDVAIGGQGYFAVQTADGSTKYTRDGSFTLNTERQIVDHQGNIVESDSGGTLTVQAQASKITIGQDGTIGTEAGLVGRLKVVKFDNAQALQSAGNNLFDAGGQTEQTVNYPVVEQGMIEGSNVNPVLEMNKMIELTRMFQTTQGVMQNEHDRVTNLIQTLTSVTA